MGRWLKFLYMVRFKDTEKEVVLATFRALTIDDRDNVSNILGKYKCLTD